MDLTIVIFSERYYQEHSSFAFVKAITKGGGSAGQHLLSTEGAKPELKARKPSVL